MSHRGTPSNDFPVKPLKNLTKVSMNNIPCPHHARPSTPPTHPFQNIHNVKEHNRLGTNRDARTLKFPAVADPAARPLPSANG
jgi:hypothetical protein